ncbi:3-deoxy-7-phosphoheptulonate synthase [Dactylosporangium sp. NPDC000555]|uniref:3-deoxy-7-phosphoheptulonate synthase n=1 Tax=Dactylosporangium sp. NPDC000555 TaxID=3154260 RepID=UPI0033220E07
MAGGIHLELAAGPVTECLGGPGPQTERQLLDHYTSLCDPRLNPVQAGALIEGIGQS